MVLHISDISVVQEIAGREIHHLSSSCVLPVYKYKAVGGIGVEMSSNYNNNCLIYDASSRIVLSLPYGVLKVMI